MKRRTVLTGLAVLVLLAIGVFRFGRSLWVPVYLTVVGKRTVASAVEEFGERTDASLRPLFEQAGLSYPSARAAYLCFKDEKRLELWGQDDGPWTFVTAFDIKAASGKLGPKLKEGDRQVPEGVYRIEGLNPNSAFHLSIKLNYPNEFDLAHAQLDGREALGGDIFIHGKTASVGCLAMGDDAAEQLFVLASRVGKDNIRVVIAPYDFRRKSLTPLPASAPGWLPDLYSSIASELDGFRITSP